MSVEMVEAVCVLVGEPTLCCREDLFVISKVGIAEGAEGKSGGIEVGLSGFGVGGLAALISEETWSGSSCEVGLEVGLCRLDWKWLQRDGGVGEDLLPSDAKLPHAHGAFPPTKSNASATCPPTVPRIQTDCSTLRCHHLPPPQRRIPIIASVHFSANSTTRTLQMPPTLLCTSSRRPPSKPPTTRTPPDYQSPRPPLPFSPVHSPSLHPVHQPHSITISPTEIMPVPFTLLMMPPYSTIFPYSLTPSPSEVSAAPARSPIVAASSIYPPPTP